MRKVSLILGLLFVLTACTPSYINPNLSRPFKGGENSSVVVKEYGDFQCPACGQAAPVVKELMEKYGEQVRWEFIHFPLTSIHAYAFNAAMASECAHDQGKFWEMHDIMFERQDSLTRSDIREYAEEIGLDIEVYDACFKSRAKSDLVRDDLADGKRLGVNSTPTFIVNNQRVQDWTQLDSILTSLLTPAVPKAEAGSES